MDKSAPFLKAFKEAMGFFDEGVYRKALSKFETALTAAPDEKSAIAARSWVIACHGRLEQVSLAELFGLV
jgi:Tfp pilus assembly protein PilF